MTVEHRTKRLMGFGPSRQLVGADSLAQTISVVTTSPSHEFPSCIDTVSIPAQFLPPFVITKPTARSLDPTLQDAIRISHRALEMRDNESLQACSGDAYTLVDALDMVRLKRLFALQSLFSQTGNWVAINERRECSKVSAKPHQDMRSNRAITILSPPDGRTVEVRRCADSWRGVR
jgi:hypothetical protein